jgi:hypothetical protein
MHQAGLADCRVIVDAAVHEKSQSPKARPLAFESYVFSG